ncbi:hypothetical protein A3A14_03490 [Candidatus Daviesbacteria bacterium RIFCSPLOWO2_01_FULL_43_38]|uniref:Uncharacterized protein n=1 Tax=Candidatus Daviesbacteria bacterium GW2011_GWA1_42_6 TaxID=1618420 RepID=A0A0G1AWX7_9BACT|nr:MAG: hypothetical protein UV33_C0001G0025 [Candidatus Daviesbacteria bacterium GW2011_GWA1_42_6]OGE63704.1 MAG: hypothetical protein A3A14_03490 [Candidatus Daviesbacteria bacterium RIFCSPLOWO2_01_FULL_43_38]
MSGWSLALVSFLIVWVLLFIVGILLIFGKLNWALFVKSINQLEGAKTKFGKGTATYYKIYGLVLGGLSIIISLYMIHFTINFYFGKEDILRLPVILNNLMYSYADFVLGK